MRQRPVTNEVGSLMQSGRADFPPLSIAANNGNPVAPVDGDRKDKVSSGKRVIKPLISRARGLGLGRENPLSQVWKQPKMLTRRSARIAIKAKGKTVFIRPLDIIAIEAKGNYVLLVHLSSSHLLRESISLMESWFGPHGFVRIHRSVLVNAAFVEELRLWPTGEYVLRVRGGRQYTVTRTHRRNLHRLAECWIGSEGFPVE